MIKAIAVLISLLVAGTAGAQSTLTNLPAITTPADTDLMYLVKPGDAAPDRKITISDLRDTLGGGVSFDTCAELAAAVSDETGTGPCVFADSPTFIGQITTPKVVWAGGQFDFSGSGSPEGVVTATVGSTYRRTNGGAATSFYVKESGSGNTGWVAYGTPAGSGAPTTATYITSTADGSLSQEFALGSLATGLLKNTTTTGIPTIAVLHTDYLSPASSITLGQLPSTLSSRTIDNTNTVTLLDTLFTLQDDGDATKQSRFNFAANTTGTISTYAFPIGSTTLLGDSDFVGTHYGPLIRTGSSTYQACRDNITATAAPSATSDSVSNYCVGSMWLDTVLGKWHRNITNGIGTATWQDLGATVEADGLSSIMGRDNSAVAESFATGLQITNAGATVVVSRFVDPTFGPRDQCSPECDATTFIPTNKNWNIYDQEGAANVLVVDPDAASKNAMYQFGAAYKPTASIAVPLTERGVVTIALASIAANQPKAYYATVTDADTDALDFEFPITAKMVGATTATVRLIGVSDNAAPSGNIVLSCAMKAYRPGTDTYTAHDTTGQVNVTLTPAVQNRPVAATSAAITINGTVADGGTMVGSCEVDAAGTTSAQLTDFFLLARATIAISVNSISD